MNAGIALFLLPIFHLIIGNALLGVMEGFIIYKVFKTRLKQTILIMIAGNYASWILGFLIVVIIQKELIEALFIFKNVFILWIISLIIFCILTIFIELPFIRWILKKSERKRPGCMNFSIFLNLCTYLMVMPVFLSVSKYNFFTDLKQNQSILNTRNDIDIFYINDRNVYSKRKNDKGPGNEIYKLPDNIEYLYFHLTKDTNSQTIGLYLSNYPGDSVMLDESFITSNEMMYYPQLSFKDSRLTADLRDTAYHNWEADFSSQLQGLAIVNENSIKQSYGFDVPWMFWGIHTVSVLNDSEILFIIKNRITLLNKNTKEIAFIAKGYDYMIRKND